MSNFIKTHQNLIDYNNISGYKERIKEEFESLKTLVPHNVDFEYKRRAIGLSAASVFARELGINLDIEELVRTAMNCNGSLNHESRADLGLAISAVSPGSNFLQYFEEPHSPYATEIKAPYADYDTFFKALYAIQISDKRPEISEENKRRLIQAGETSLDRIVSMIDKRFDEHLIFELKPILISYLALTKEFEEFRVPKDIINNIYSKISKFEKSEGIKWGIHTRSRIFAEKIILAALNELE